MKKHVKKISIFLVALLLLGIGLPNLQSEAEVREGYEELDWEPSETLGYWQSNNGRYVENPTPNTGAGNSPNFISSKLFSREDLPVGSILIIEEGFQYRPDGYGFEGGAEPGRPGNVVGPNKIVITESWWEGFEYRGFNIAKPGTANMHDVFEEAREAFTILVPDFEYEQVDWGADGFGTWEPTRANQDYENPHIERELGNSEDFIPSARFTQEQLPAGTVIEIIEPDFLIVPMHWATEGRDAHGDGAGWVFGPTGQFVLTEEWWEGKSHFAFNAAKLGQNLVENDLFDDVVAAINIWVPVQEEETEEPELPTREGYDLFDWEPDGFGIWHAPDHPENPTIIRDAWNSSDWIPSARRFTEEDLPVGTIIEIAPPAGADYILESHYWGEDNFGHSPWLAGPIEFEVTAEWWEGIDYRAIQVGKFANNLEELGLFDEVVGAVNIWVPVEEDPGEEEPDPTPIEREGYEVFDWQPFETLGYWQSGHGDYNPDPQLVTGAGNSVNFIASARLSREDLPVGSILIIEEGYQYRPDGWVFEGVAAPGRPGNVVGPSEIEVTEEWWADFEYRGFNVAVQGNSAHVGDIYDEVVAAFTILVPEADETPIDDELVQELLDLIADLEARIKELEESNEVADLEDQIDSLEQDLADLQARVDALEEENEDLAQLIAELQAELAELRAQLEDEDADEDPVDQDEDEDEDEEEDEDPAGQPGNNNNNGKVPNPQTLDTTNNSLYLVLASLSLLAMLFLGYIRKRSNA